MIRVARLDRRECILRLGDSASSKIRVKGHLGHVKNDSIDLDLDELIPGIPNDLAILCLLRLPRAAHFKCSLVCRGWKSLIFHSNYFSLRETLGFKQPWLYVRVFVKAQKCFMWHAFDPSTTRWLAMPQVPCQEQLKASGVGCGVIDGFLYMAGGMGTSGDGPLRSLHRYNPRSQSWNVLSPLVCPRAFAATLPLNGCLVVAGGNSTYLRELRSAELFDPKSNCWQPFAPMASGIACYQSAVVGSTLCITEGWHWPFHFSPRGFVYDISKQKWAHMPLGMSEGWIGPSFQLDGRLYILEHSDERGGRFFVYSGTSDEWHQLEGDPMPSELSAPFVVRAIQGKVYVVGKHLATSIVNFRNCTNTGGTFQWSKVISPSHLVDVCPETCEVIEL